MNELNIANYEVDKDKVDVRQEISEMLRMPGMCKDGLEICDAIILARSVVGSDSDTIELTDVELALLMKVMNTLIKRPHNPQQRQYSLGGKRYEELVMRVFLMNKEK